MCHKKHKYVRLTSSQSSPLVPTSPPLPMVWMTSIPTTSSFSWPWCGPCTLSVADSGKTSFWVKGTSRHCKTSFEILLKWERHWRTWLYIFFLPALVRTWAGQHSWTLQSDSTELFTSILWRFGSILLSLSRALQAKAGTTWDYCWFFKEKNTKNVADKISPLGSLAHMDSGGARRHLPVALRALCCNLRRGLWSGASSKVSERMTVSHRNWAPLMSSSLSSAWASGSSSSLCCLSFTAERNTHERLFMISFINPRNAENWFEWNKILENRQTIIMKFSHWRSPNLQKKH